LARIRLTVTPPVMVALGLDRAVLGAKRRLAALAVLIPAALIAAKDARERQGGA